MGLAFMGTRVSSAIIFFAIMSSVASVYWVEAKAIIARGRIIKIQALVVLGNLSADRQKSSGYMTYFLILNQLFA